MRSGTHTNAPRSLNDPTAILINLLRKEKQRAHSNASPTPSPADPADPQEAEADAPGGQATLPQFPVPPVPVPVPATEYEPVIRRLIGQNFTLAEREAFKIFAADRKNRIEVEMTKTALRAKFEEARVAAERIKLTRKRMVSLHNEMKVLSDSEPAQRVKKAALQEELSSEQASYRKTLMDLQLLKVETGHQKHAVEQAKLRLLRKFQDWWAAQMSCCSPIVVAESPCSTPARPHSSQGPRPDRADPQRLQLQGQQLRPWSAGQAGTNACPCITGSTPPSTPLVRPPESQLGFPAGPGAAPVAGTGNATPITTLWTRPLPVALPLPPRPEATCLPSPAAIICDQDQAEENQHRGEDDDETIDVVKETSTVTAIAEDAPTAPPPPQAKSKDDEDFIRNSIPLTGEPEVDREIIEFYKARNRICQS